MEVMTQFFTAQEIRGKVCRHYNVPSSFFLIPDRGKAKETWIRQIYIYCLWRFTRLNSYQIADLIGRNRTIVSTTVKMINNRCQFEDPVRKEVIEIESMFE